MEARCGDLNPVAVLIQRAMLEIPPRFAGRPPVHPGVGTALATWARAQGLAADIEAYGRWMLAEARARIGHLYPDATGPNGRTLTPIAWIWARTVTSPDPAWAAPVPLVASWVLARRPDKPVVWIEPIVDRTARTISYAVRHGGAPSHPRTVKGGNGTCIATGAAIPGPYIKAEARAGRMGQTLMAVVAEGDRRKSYGPATLDQLEATDQNPEWRPSEFLPDRGLGFSVQNYGKDQWWKLFAPRQLTALTTFSDLLAEVGDRVIGDAVAAGFDRDRARLRAGGSGATAYGDAVVTYLAFVIDKCADYWSAICTWSNTRETARNTFSRQAIPMTWGYAETNPFSSSTGSWTSMVKWVGKVVAALPAHGTALVTQRDARARVRECAGAMICTDPPYYDNIGYGGISDFFYVWLRRNLADVWPDDCATLLTPKTDELIADFTRHGSRQAAEAHFESGMATFMAELARAQSPDVPATVFYAYKATETSEGRVRSTGWDTFLQAVVDAGLQVTAT